MTARERVLAACAFRPPDRVPRFDSFWEFPDAWAAAIGPAEKLSDIAIWPPDETPFPRAARRIADEGGWIYERDGWGRTTRRREGAYFVETLRVAIPPGTDPDAVAFDPPELERRYLMGCLSAADCARALADANARYCVFGKTGGPFLRTTFVRGETQFLIDIAEDPSLARALAEKVADHLTAVGVEAIRRWGLQETGIWIYDDMAHNAGPFFSPAAFERIFLPVWRRMIAAYKAAGARYVFLHSDGDVRPVLDMLVDAGIDGLHPLERRAGMDPFALRARYPHLVLVGGMCNTDTLIHGPAQRIRDEARRLVDLGRSGGMIIGTHSISPEIPVEHFLAYDETCRTYGDFSVHVMSTPTHRA